MLIYLHAVSPSIPHTSNDSYKLLKTCEDEEAILQSSDENDDIEVIIRSPPPPSCGPFSKYCFLIPIAFIVTYPIEMFPILVRWYLKLSNTQITLLILILFFSNAILINKDALQDQIYLKVIPNEAAQSSNTVERLDKVTPNMTFDDAIEKNSIWNKYDLEAMIQPGCIKRTPGHDRWCDYEVKGIRMFDFQNRIQNIGCEPLAATPKDKGCVKKLAEFVKFIESAKPDYAFMFTRFFAVADPFDKNNTDLEKDRTYLEMRSQLNKFLPSIKKKLFILDSFPRAKSSYIGNIAKDLKKGKKIEEVSRAVWIPRGEEPPVQPKANLHEKKCLLSCFWDAKDMLYYELLPQGRTVNATTYSNQLASLALALRENRPLKLFLKEKRFAKYEALKMTVFDFFDSQSAAFGKKGIDDLPERWLTVVTNDGQYIVY
uniref:SGNH domain-containing protein n=1 Tax=Caenorhabditis japonica TaxID=281687 RepID=A0A8R1HQ14_CAEJA